MGLASLQVCMDSSDWLQGTVPEDSSGMDSSSPLSNDMLTCSRPLNMERRLRPQHDQALKCPRCDSTHTKFCYYNNYSLSQPRYFCKTCRRYWTKGGTLRNIPVGGGCRKNKKVSSSKKPNDDDNNNSNNNSPVVGQIIHHAATPASHNTTDLQLSFPDQVQFSHLTNLLGGPHGHPSFFEHHPKPIDFMESKLEAIVGSSRNNSYNDFMGSTNSTSGHDLGMVGVGLCNFGGGGGGGGADSTHQHHGMSSLEPNFHGISCPHPFGMSLDGNIGNNGTTFMDTCQRLMLPYEANHDQDQGGVDVKPNAKILSLDWQDQGCSSDHHAGKDSFGYINGLGSWSNVMNNYGPSTTNSSLV